MGTNPQHAAKNQNEEEADLILTTAHRSKGIESDYVMIADDFDSLLEAASGESDSVSEEEINLFYVACTRAKEKLYLPPCYRQLFKSGILTESIYESKTEKLPEAPPTLSTALPDQQISIPTVHQTLGEKLEKTQLPAGQKDHLANDVIPGMKIEVGTDPATNKKIYWEPTNTSRFLNPNLSILGTMGTGKTQSTQSILFQLHQQKNRNAGTDKFDCLIFDYKDDYSSESFLKATGAKLLWPRHLPINPFSLTGDLNDPQLPLHTAAVFIKTLTKAYGLGVKQQNRLRDAIIEAYSIFGIHVGMPETFKKSEEDMPSVDDVFRVLTSRKCAEDSLYAALSDITTFQFFKSPHDNEDNTKSSSIYDMINGIVVIDIKRLDGKTQNLFVALILDAFFSQMQIHGKPQITGEHRALAKLILVDEADNLMSGGYQALKRILKEGREYGVGCVLSTQELTHFKSKDEDYSALMQSWILHNVPSLTSKQVDFLLNPASKKENEQYLSTVKKLKKHQSLFVDGQKQSVQIDDLPFFKLVSN